MPRTRLQYSKPPWRGGGRGDRGGRGFASDRGNKGGKRGRGGYVPYLPGCSPDREESMFLHQDRESYFCDICKQQMSSKSAFVTHCNSEFHKEKEGNRKMENVWLCNTCTKPFLTKVGLDQHCLLERHQAAYRVEGVPKDEKVKGDESKHDARQQIFSFGPLNPPNYCDVCQVDCLNSSNMRVHLESWRHRAEVDRKQDEENEKRKTSDKLVDAGDERGTKRRNDDQERRSVDIKEKDAQGKKVEDFPNKRLEEDAIKDCYCDICDVHSTSTHNYIDHVYGKKHQRKVSSMNPPFRCIFCNIKCGSVKDFNVHYEGKRHIDKASKMIDAKEQDREKNDKQERGEKRGREEESKEKRAHRSRGTDRAASKEKDRGSSNDKKTIYRERSYEKGSPVSRKEKGRDKARHSKDRDKGKEGEKKDRGRSKDKDRSKKDSKKEKKQKRIRESSASCSSSESNSSSERSKNGKKRKHKDSADKEGKKKTKKGKSKKKEKAGSKEDGEQEDRTIEIKEESDEDMVGDLREKLNRGKNMVITKKMKNEKAGNAMEEELTGGVSETEQDKKKDEEAIMNRHKADLVLREQLLKEHSIEIFKYKDAEDEYKRLCLEEDYLKRRLDLFRDGDPRKDNDIADLSRIENAIREVREELDIRDLMIQEKERYLIVLKNRLEERTNIIAKVEQVHQNAPKLALEQTVKYQPIQMDNLPRMNEEVALKREVPVEDAVVERLPDKQSGGPGGDLRLEIEKERLLRKLGPGLAAVDSDVRQRILDALITTESAQKTHDFEDQGSERMSTKEDREAPRERGYPYTSGRTHQNLPREQDQNAPKEAQQTALGDNHPVQNRWEDPYFDSPQPNNSQRNLGNSSGAPWSSQDSRLGVERFPKKEARPAKYDTQSIGSTASNESQRINESRRTDDSDTKSEMDNLWIAKEKELRRREDELRQRELELMEREKRRQANEGRMSRERELTGEERMSRERELTGEGVDSEDLAKKISNVREELDRESMSPVRNDRMRQVSKFTSPSTDGDRGHERDYNRRRRKSSFSPERDSGKRDRSFRRHERGSRSPDNNRRRYQAEKTSRRQGSYEKRSRDSSARGYSSKRRHRSHSDSSSPDRRRSSKRSDRNERFKRRRRESDQYSDEDLQDSLAQFEEMITMQTSPTSTATGALQNIGVLTGTGTPVERELEGLYEEERERNPERMPQFSSAVLTEIKRHSVDEPITKGNSNQGSRRREQFSLWKTILPEDGKGAKRMEEINKEDIWDTAFGTADKEKEDQVAVDIFADLDVDSDYLKGRLHPTRKGHQQVDVFQDSEMKETIRDRTLERKLSKDRDDSNSVDFPRKDLFPRKDSFPRKDTPINSGGRNNAPRSIDEAQYISRQAGKMRENSRTRETSGGIAAQQKHVEKGRDRGFEKDRVEEEEEMLYGSEQEAITSSQQGRQDRVAEAKQAVDQRLKEESRRYNFESKIKPTKTQPPKSILKRGILKKPAETFVEKSLQDSVKLKNTDKHNRHEDGGNEKEKQVEEQSSSNLENDSEQNSGAPGVIRPEDLEKIRFIIDGFKKQYGPGWDSSKIEADLKLVIERQRSGDADDRQLRESESVKSRKEADGISGVATESKRPEISAPEVEQDPPPLKVSLPSDKEKLSSQRSTLFPIKISEKAANEYGGKGFIGTQPAKNEETNAFLRLPEGLARRGIEGFRDNRDLKQQQNRPEAPSVLHRDALPEISAPNTYARERRFESHTMGERDATFQVQPGRGIARDMEPGPSRGPATESKVHTERESLIAQEDALIPMSRNQEVYGGQQFVRRYQRQEIPREFEPMNPEARRVDDMRFRGFQEKETALRASKERDVPFGFPEGRKIPPRVEEYGKAVPNTQRGSHMEERFRERRDLSFGGAGEMPARESNERGILRERTMERLPQRSIQEPYGSEERRGGFVEERQHVREQPQDRLRGPDSFQYQAGRGNKIPGLSDSWGNERDEGDPRVSRQDSEQRGNYHFERDRGFPKEQSQQLPQRPVPFHRDRSYDEQLPERSFDEREPGQRASFKVEYTERAWEAEIPKDDRSYPRRDSSDNIPQVFPATSKDKSFEESSIASQQRDQAFDVSQEFDYAFKHIFKTVDEDAAKGMFFCALCKTFLEDDVERSIHAHTENHRKATEQKESVGNFSRQEEHIPVSSSSFVPSRPHKRGQRHSGPPRGFLGAGPPHRPPYNDQSRFPRPRS